MKPGLFVAGMVLLAGCVSPPAQRISYSPALAPPDVVALYFNAWAAKDYEPMYAAISDGFKKIEPTAASYENFTAYMSKFYESSRSIKLVSVNETANDNTAASVDYTIEIEQLDGTRTPFSGSYTLRYRANDTAPGWKLIHPYGKNVDAS